MTPIEIKILLMRRRMSIAALARVYAEKFSATNLESLRKRLSMCINREREYPHLQQFIADQLDRDREQLFGRNVRRKAA